jgi:hypothetical protein
MRLSAFLPGATTFGLALKERFNRQAAILESHKLAERIPS